MPPLSRSSVSFLQGTMWQGLSRAARVGTSHLVGGSAADPGTTSLERWIEPRAKRTKCSLGRQASSSEVRERTRMTSGPQMERSLLEAKERDELQTIAHAMELKTSARASKATLIGAILGAAGTTNGATNGASDAPATEPHDMSASNGSSLSGDAELVAVGASATATSTEQDAPESMGDAGRGPRPQSTGSGPYDPASRRNNNRRRRGRDRERGGDRDLQGAQGAQEQAYSGELVEVRGLLDLKDEGYGFVRTSGYRSSTKDVYV